jgi:O-Antigen ligase
MIFNRTKLIEIIFLTAFFLLLPLWNLPDTIALRYLLSLTLLIVVIFSKIEWETFFTNNPFLILLFFYILIQLIFFSSNFKLAFLNFKSEWLKFILFAITGIGCGKILYTKKLPNLLFYLGLFFVIPLVIHLFMSVWKGLLIGYLPIGYWGINKTHGDLAYTSMHATLFLMIFYLFQANTTYQKLLTFALLGTCIFSPLIASSRGGVIFVFLSIITILILKILIHSRSRWLQKHLIMYVLGTGVLILCIFKVGETLDPQRWSGTISRLEMGFKGDALKINCEGIESLETTLREEGFVVTPKISDILNAVQSGQNGDIARMLAARAAIQLIPQHWMGIDQSKLGYDQALEKACGHAPKIKLSNAHNGWLDTALAIGFLGAILYFLVCCNFLKQGLKSCSADTPEIIPYGVALSALSMIWILRSIFDSAQRDQMLEMQIFTLCLLSSYILSKRHA